MDPRRAPKTYKARRPARPSTKLFEFVQENGAQGRDRTTDTAIFSRMLYQLSYLGMSRGNNPSERAVYSEVGRLCPPRFAFRFARRGPASALPPSNW
jgi:hypothetical protein